jgi:hypothetical protein
MDIWTTRLTAAQRTDVLASILHIYFGTRAMLNPIAYAKDFGFPLDASDTASHPFIVAIGIRTLALGMSHGGFALSGQSRSASVVLRTVVLCGVVDMAICYNGGSPGSWMIHAVGTTLFALLALWLRA